MANKLILVCLVALAVAVATVCAVGGVKDLAGNYYDFTTGQVASSATGKVYNTRYPGAHHYAVYPAYYAAYPGGYYVH